MCADDKKELTQAESVQDEIGEKSEAEYREERSGGRRSSAQ